MYNTDDPGGVDNRIDQRLDNLEALVTRALCKCIYHELWVAYNGCPIHSPHLLAKEKL